MNKIVHKRFDIDVTGENQTFSKTFELDKDIVTVKGVGITSNRDDLVYARGEQRIEINREEFFPDNYESKRLMAGVNSDVNTRYYDLGNVSSGNKTIKVDYKDVPNELTLFRPHRVSYYFLCEKVEMQ